MIKLQTKFKPFNSFTTDFIKNDVLPKLNQQLDVVSGATEGQLTEAVSAFFAYGQRNYVVDFTASPLLEHVGSVLVNYGWLRPDSTVKNVFRIPLPMNRLAFITTKQDRTALKLDTVYGTRYVDGTHDEVVREDYRYVDGFPADVWFEHHEAA